MLLLKQGHPDENELVMCAVTKVMSHSVFVKIDEYNKSGMIHISEISPGRIRNIRDYVVEGKVIVCKVLKIDKVKGHIDLTLRRVTESQKRGKIDEIKQQQKVEKIIEFVAKEEKGNAKELLNQINEKIPKKYESIHHFFENVIADKAQLQDLGLNEKTTAKLLELIKQRIKPPIVEIKGNLILKSYAPDGVEVVRNTIKKVMDKGKESFNIKYSGAGKYKIIIRAQDYKEAEKILKNCTEVAFKYIEKAGGEGKFIRESKHG